MHANPKIPLHQLTSSELLIFSIESADDETFDGLHRHDFFELIWFTTSGGCKSIEIDFESYPIEDNTICLLAPGQVFRMLKTNQQGYVLAFSRTLSSDLLDDSALYSTGFLPRKFTAESLIPVKCLEELLINELSGQQRADLLKLYCKAFLIHCNSQHDSRQRPDHKSSILIRLIEEHYLSQRTTGFYATQMHISPKYLNALVKMQRGVTVKQLISERLLLEAKREINFGKLSLKEIAFRLGFDDPAYFSRFFKVQAGLTAEQFKESVHRR